MLTIIGCGNPNRSDDGAGVAVVRRLLERLGNEAPKGSRIFDAGTAGMEVMFKARGASELILVDASSSNSEPGSIFDVPGQLLASVPEPGHGSHGFRWDHALHAGKRIFRHEFPDRVTVYLIEKQTLELGLRLSEPVERAVTRVVEIIINRLQAIDPERALAAGPVAGGSRPRADAGAGVEVKSVDKPSIRIQNGSLYLDAELYDTHFRGRDSVGVMQREHRIAVFPLAPGSVGGSLAKVRNARGDRVVHARELLRALDLDDGDAHELVAEWDAELSALTVPRPTPRKA